MFCVFVYLLRIKYFIFKIQSNSIKKIKNLIIITKKSGIGDWGLGIGDWGLTIPNPQSPIPK